MQTQIAFIKDSLENGKSFDDIYQKVKEIDRKRQDFIVSDAATNMWMADDATMSFSVQDIMGNSVVRNMPLSEWAMSQVCNKFRVGASYIDRCISSGHADLAAENINTWITHKTDGRPTSQKYMLRTYDGIIDGFVSSKFSRFDTQYLLDAVKDSLNITDYHMVGSYVSDERLHLRMIQDKMLDVENEDLYPGIFIDSSDVGRSKLRVQFGIWKKVCTNGMCISKVGGVLMERKHLGVHTEDVIEELKKNMQMVPMLIEKSESVIKKAKGEEILRDGAAFKRIIEDVQHMTKLTDEEVNEMITLAEVNYDMSRWGIVNSMTEFAQRFDIYRRLQIENAAGIIVAQ